MKAPIQPQLPQLQFMPTPALSTPQPLAVNQGAPDHVRSAVSSFNQTYIEVLTLRATELRAMLEPLTEELRHVEKILRIHGEI